MRLVEKNMHEKIIDQIYASSDIPMMYEEWKICISRMDHLYLKQVEDKKAYRQWRSAGPSGQQQPSRVQAAPTQMPAARPAASYQA